MPSQQPHHQDDALRFHCNFVVATGRSCGCAVSQGWMTDCSHLFCNEHAKEWFASNVDCPVCVGGRATRVVKVNFAPPSREARIIAVGMTPRSIFEAAIEAFDFWAGQKWLESTWHETAKARMHARENRLKDAYRERADYAKVVMEELSVRRVELQKKVEESTNRRDALEAEFEQTKAYLKRLRGACNAQLQSRNTTASALLGRSSGLPFDNSVNGDHRHRQSGDAAASKNPFGVGIAHKRTGDSVERHDRSVAEGLLRSSIFGTASAGGLIRPPSRATRRRLL